MASSGTVRLRPLRLPVVVTMATGSALSMLDIRCRPFVTRNVSRSSGSSTRANSHEPGPLAAKRRSARCSALASANGRGMSVQAAADVARRVPGRARVRDGAAVAHALIHLVGHPDPALAVVLH